MTVFVSLALSGCAISKPSGSPSPGSTLSQSRINEINVLAMPVALNLDSEPGVDGFAIKVYAVDASRPKTQPIQDGTLDILMYDGLLREITPDTSRYRRVWSFSADQLKAHAFATAIGMGYRFTLAWESDKPRDDKISIVVRYRPVHGPDVYSASSSISIPGK